MTPLFISVLLAALCLEGRAQQDTVLQPEGDVTATEGEAATLGCRYVSSSASASLHWYKQEGTNSPKFILSRFLLGEGNKADDFRERFSSTMNSTSFPLKIQKLQPSDSAVYYCALQRSLSGTNRIVFGAGTKLTVNIRDDYEPSYYELEDENQTIRACLATGFSRNNATLLHDLFKNPQAQSGAVRAADDSLHSEVVLMSGGSGGKCENGTHQNEPDVCADTLDKDVTVNTVSLLVVALRLLFLKTVVFNVLMTLRLWLSH